MENTMKKILSLALILGATALMACPMQQGMMNGGMMMQKIGRASRRERV